MRPSDWGFVLEDIKKDAARIELERSRLKNTLIQSIGVVARGNPALLVEGPGADAADPSESTPALSWNRIVREYLTHDGSSNDETPGVYLARKRAFILFTEKQGAQINGKRDRVREEMCTLTIFSLRQPCILELCR